MPRGRKAGVAGLKQQLERLRKERHEMAARLAQIDDLFNALGVPMEPAARVGRPAGAAAMSGAAAAPAKRGRRRRRRRRFGSSGTDSVLDFVRQAGKGGATSKAISQNWKSQGRSGEPYIALGQLVKQRKLKKQGIPGERGSRYTVA